MTEHRANPSATTDRVLSEVLAERIRQDAKWGEQNHPDGTGLPVYRHAARRYRDAADRNAAAGVLTWRDVSNEEHFEALAESDPVKLRAELVQSAAVKVAWIEAIDRRTKTTEQQPTTEACARCEKPFDPTDTRFDGRAQHKLTPYCRWCVDLCQDNESADHRCVICA
ncbi:hypothetical protein [Streptomyces sp. SID12488]|uniref:hypothetical protein n=1 Tax=Streptomyces sp. SID12488 TaxID=2706040 RepID=UPI001EF3B769|nr:hypothetical protein [Streptomyces sp. SID12488]